MKAKGGTSKATEQPIDTGTAAGKCFLDMLGVFAEFETNLRKERQLEGIAKAKAAGVYKGRPASSAPRNSSRRRAWGHHRLPSISALAARLSIAPWRPRETYSASLKFSWAFASQSRHRYFRPPAFASVPSMGLLHLRQRGGGRFLTTMMLTVNWAGAQNSQSPMEADGRAVMEAA